MVTLHPTCPNIIGSPMWTICLIREQDYGRVSVTFGIRFTESVLGLNS